MVAFSSIFVRLHVAAAIRAAVVGAMRLEGSLTRVATRSGFVFFHPEQPLLGNIPPGPLGEAHLRLKEHNVAFMLRALRTVARGVRHSAPDGGRELLTSRFPSLRMHVDRKVRRHCRHGFVSCVTYLSHVAHNLSLSIHNDQPTVKQGRRKGMCFKKSRRLSIFCEPHHKKPSTPTKKIRIDVQKGVSNALEKISEEKWVERQSISTRMKSIKPTVPKKISTYKKSLKYLENTKKETKVEVKEKHVLTNIRNTTFAIKLELYRLTVTALQYVLVHDA